MRKINLLFLFLCATLSLYAQKGNVDDKTTDKITVSEITLEPGGIEGYFTVNLEGNTTYTAYGMDVFLPEGFELNYFKGNPEVYMDKKGGLYPSEEDREGTTYFHEFRFSTPHHQQIRVACIPTSRRAFAATSGKLFKIYVKATPYAKPGVNQVRVEGIEMVLPDATPKHPENVSFPIHATNHSSVEINIAPENKFGTYIFPFDCEKPANVHVYSCFDVDDNNNFVRLTEENAIKAFTPYVLYAENGCTTTLSGTVDEASYTTSRTNGKLTGVTILTEVAQGYILQNQGAGAKFYRANPQAPFSLRAGRCFLDVPTIAMTNVYNIDLTPTGINGISQDNAAANIIYDFQGHRVYYPVPGRIYIVNGNKVLMK